MIAAINLISDVWPDASSAAKKYDMITVRIRHNITECLQ